LAKRTVEPKVKLVSLSP